MTAQRERVGVRPSGIGTVMRKAGVFALVVQTGCFAANASKGQRAAPMPASMALASSGSPPSGSPPASDPSSASSEVAAQEVRADFSKANSCPAERITATATSAAAVTPPPEVAADPGRLAVWQQNQTADPKKRFDVTGCGQHVRFACNVFADPPSAFCLPDFDDVTSHVIIGPATAQRALAQLARDQAGGGARLGVAFASVPGLGLVIITAVMPGGAADGKLRVGDVIVAAGGQPVTDGASLIAVVEGHAGTALDVRVRRDGQETNVTVNVPVSVTISRPPP